MPATTSGSSLRAVLEGLMKGEDVPKHKAVVCSSADCFLLFEVSQTILTIISEKHTVTGGTLISGEASGYG